MADYKSLSKGVQEQIRQDRKEHWINPCAFRDEDVVRRHMDHDRPFLWRPAFVSDTEKIMHNTYYNRYSDKTQVFSLYKNDDITRRGFHVQLVSRIARNIGAALNLNLDLIEAISLGHDLGHTPFGHDGERMLNQLLFDHTGRYFNHNVHSVRILDQLIQRNISLQTLDGILCHNGEMEQQEYRPQILDGFDDFDSRVEQCYTEEGVVRELVPSTLEACVMRICDIIAYLGKDRQDAQRVGLISAEDDRFSRLAIGNSNAEIINNLTVDIIENSYRKDYLSMSPEVYEALQQGKRENGKLIYKDEEMMKVYHEQIRPMFSAIYEKLLQQAESKEKNSILYRHHICFLKENNQYSSYFNLDAYIEGEPNQIVVDYMASMTDDYLVELYHHLFPDREYKVKYVGYFEQE
ncbi:MAG: HD domain-containing protein [Lachnospiraceae bacterium]|nr:HD domain-containing protein [Lachnospiraceae bacterium]